MRPTASRWVAAGLIAFAALAVLVAFLQLGKTTTASKDNSNDDGITLNGSGSRLAYISLEGMIIEDADKSSFLGSDTSAVKARKMLYLAARDNNVKGVLLRINSPGGTVGMSQELYNAVLAVRRKKPVVVSMGDLAASGGYYTASAADRIVANPGTLTASIGVILQSLNLQGLVTNKLGVKAITIKSGTFKDILSPYRQPTPADMQLLQKIINVSYHQFLNAVLVGRTMGLTDPQQRLHRIQAITAIADGRVVIGEDALRIGLVDQLGGLEEAKHLLQDLAGKRFNIKPEKLQLKEYETTLDVWQFLGMEASNTLHPMMSLPGQDNPRAWLPSSLRYANQPLWMMETLN